VGSAKPGGTGKARPTRLPRTGSVRHPGHGELKPPADAGQSPRWNIDGSRAAALNTA